MKALSNIDLNAIITYYSIRKQYATRNFNIEILYLTEIDNDDSAERTTGVAMLVGECGQRPGSEIRYRRTLVWRVSSTEPWE